MGVSLTDTDITLKSISLDVLLPSVQPTSHPVSVMHIDTQNNNKIIVQMCKVTFAYVIFTSYVITASILKFVCGLPHE